MEEKDLTFVVSTGAQKDSHAMRERDSQRYSHMTGASVLLACEGRAYPSKSITAYIQQNKSKSVLVVSSS